MRGCDGAILLKGGANRAPFVKTLLTEREQFGGAPCSSSPSGLYFPDKGDMAKLLDEIELPHGLRSLAIQELNQVAAELRDELIDTVATCGGHFASSLGATEITVALHHLFQTPNDKLIWDVGHQGYIHKMVTGRRDRLASIRQLGGLSGFLRRDESQFDEFGAGHAGTSISAAVGIAHALRKSDPERKVVAIIGDGSLTAGMAFEAMNHAGELGLGNLIVVLNDNEMSISPNVGAISWLFSTAITSKASTTARARFKQLYKKGLVPELVYRILDKAEEATQGFITSPSMLFESFGFRYIGPVDGHNIQDLVHALKNAKQQDVPVLVHAYTVKGKGYQPAESDPLTWHGVVPFDRGRGEFLSSGGPKKIPAPSYTAVFASTFKKLAEADSRIVGITAAMLSGTGLDKVLPDLPEQVVDVGICEQHAVTYAAGLACAGKRPICAIYSTFLQRAYDQVVHDVCIQNLPVVFAIDRAGVVGNDGETHQGLFDIGYLRTLPQMVIMSPKDENELQHMLFTAVNHQGPIALRYPRGNGVGVELDTTFENLPIGRGEIVRRGSDALFIAFGPLVNDAISAASELALLHGIEVEVINARFAKPLDVTLLCERIAKHRVVCTIEDHALLGGFGSAVVEMVNEFGVRVTQPIRRFGAPDHFVPHGSQAEQRELLGYDTKALTAYILGEFSPRKLAAGRNSVA